MRERQKEQDGKYIQRDRERDTGRHRMERERDGVFLAADN